MTLHLLLVLAALLVTTKLFGALAQRIGQPAVLGELLAGVLLGGSLLRVLDPGDPIIHSLSELGVIVLLFEIGLETDLRAMARVAGTATLVAVVGVVLPFALGFFAAFHVLGLGHIASLICGAALTATSIGISARVLSDLGMLNTREGQVVLGAAVLDDIIGLILLSVITTVVLGGTSSAGAGSAMILGAFGAGMILHETRRRTDIQRATKIVGYFLVPVFFAAVGASVDLSTFADSLTLATGGLLILVGVAGKFAAGFAPWRFHGNKRLIGVAMIPRGEVGLIFAQMGLAAKAITPAIFSALTLMVMVTTFIVPPLLAAVGRRATSEEG